MRLFSGKEIRELFAEKNWKKGREYWQAGLVKDLIQGKGSWQATVIGLTGHHRVRIRIAGNSLTANCSCMEPGGPCQHAAAVLWGWTLAPGDFLKIDQLLNEVKNLSKEEAVKLLSQLTLEEGALLQRTLFKRQQKNPQLTGAALLCLVYSIGFNSGSPWVNWRLFIARYQSALKLIAEAIKQEEERAWEALVVIITQLKDLLLKKIETKDLFLPLFFEATELFFSQLPFNLNNEMLRKIITIYLFVPLQDEEEEKFYYLFSRLLEKGLAKKTNFLHLLSSFDDQKNLSEISEIKKLRLRGLIIIRFGTEKEADIFINNCKEHLLSQLILLDLLEENNRNEKAKSIIKWGLSKITTLEERYVLRYRLARIHKRLGELKPALFLELLNFEERPGNAEYLSIKELATKVGEWEAVKERLRECPKNTV